LHPFLLPEKLNGVITDFEEAAANINDASFWLCRLPTTAAPTAEIASDF